MAPKPIQQSELFEKRSAADFLYIMRNLLLLSALAAVVSAQIPGTKIAIQTQGVFNSTGNSVSSTGTFFLPTRSFEILDSAGLENVAAVYNLGAFSGPPDGSSDHLELALYQSANDSQPVYVGKWVGQLKDGMIRLDRGELHYRDQGIAYAWRLTQYEFALGEFTPVDAVVTMTIRTPSAE